MCLVRSVRSFRDLEVYQLATEQSSKLFEITRRFPREERFALTNQIRRSSRGVAPLIAEAWARHSYAPAFRNTISIALGEVCETQAWLDQALNQGYITLDEFNELNDGWQRVWAMLYKTMNRR